jgi:CarD family transcriptional regulator
MAGLRPVIDARQATEVLAFLGRRARSLSGETWSKRQRVCLAKLTSGSINHAAEVLRELLRMRRDKSLSLTEQRLLDSARRLVVIELAVALGRAEKDVESQIDAILPAPPPKPYRPEPDE